MSGGGGDQRSESESTQEGSQSFQFDPAKGDFQSILMDLFKGLSPQLLETSQNIFTNLLNPLSQGEHAAGIFGDLGKGLSEEAISNIIERSTQEINVGGAGTGTLDSGTLGAVRARGAQDIGVQAELAKQNQLQQLLGLAVGGPGAAFAPFSGFGNNLQGLLGQPTGQTTNIFQKSFQNQNQGGGGFFG